MSDCYEKSCIPDTTKAGAKLIFSFPHLGTVKSQIKAERHLKLNAVYVIKDIWCEPDRSYVTFLEVPGHCFNLEHFALAQKAFELSELYDVLENIIVEHDVAVHNLECIAKEFKTQSSRLNKLQKELSRHVK